MNFNYEIEKINPINISDEEFSTNNIPDNVRKSIAFYNRAVRNMKIRCVDLAITDLKKSLSLNSDFFEALKLLGLCYYYKKDYNKAEKIFKKLAKYDVITANNYIQHITSVLPRYRKKVKSPRNWRKEFAVSFLILAIIITMSGAAYSKSSIVKSMFKINRKAGTTEDKKIKQQKTISEANVKRDEKYKTLEKNYQVIKAELDSYNNKKVTASILNDAESFYYDGNYEKSLDNLIILKSLELDDMEKSRFDKLWNSIKTNDVWTIYNQANTLYKQGNYQEALPKLLKVQQIAPELDVMPWALYQIGNCYKQANDNANALIFFERVKSEYPYTEYAGYSEGMINEINSK